MRIALKQSLNGVIRTESKMRCFIGLPAAPSVVPKIVKAQERALELDAGARPVRDTNFHLTLAFIGDIERSKAQEIAQLLPLTTDFTGTDWLIDTSGLFIRPQVAWVGGNMIPALEHLARESREILRRLDVRFDECRFKPHITILRKSHLADPIINKPFLWPILRPRIFESTTDDQGRRVYLPL